MPIYVHITAKCDADASTHGQSSLLANVKIQVEGTQSLTGFGFFLPTSFVKKPLGRSFRLVGYRVSIGSDELVLFLRILARGGNDYAYFLENWDTNTDQVVKQLQPYDDAQLRQIHAALSAVPPPQPLPVPTDDERGWLYEVFRAGTATDELLILETDAWVRKMRAPETREFLALYHQTVEQLEPTQLTSGSSKHDVQIHWESTNKRVGIAYVFQRDLNRLLLLEPLRQSDDVDAIIAHHRTRLARVGETVHELSRVAGRSYPYVMVLDHGAWLAIQKDEEANLALSPEEAELLESIRKTGVEGELGYPLFINGRAGSGKSTMLQYLAADYIDFALRRPTTLAAIYMTGSRDLLERARDTVRGLLMAHHERLLDGVHDPARVEATLKKSFVVLHDFFYSLLPPEDRERFAPARYVNYAEFRRRWIQDFGRRPEAKRMSPDVAWHTIRSFIKGVRSTQDDELGPEEFAALPRRRRSVSVDTYRHVYERVWCSWYKRLCEEEGVWDDQDLAARVLALGAARTSDFAAVFCDEAQDFTPLELEIIFQLSVYSKRSLLSEELRRVPIVFAGDPLQTINPTGFRWDAVQADFHERFCAVLDPRRRGKVNISYHELRFNYRSNPGIVRFCNLIQLVRAALLGGRDVRPQEAWWVDEPAQTVWFAADNAFTKQQLRQRPDLVKLVNCEEGEESDYARADPILSALKEESDGVFRNILGPTRAKGLEFPAVVIYRFAETAPSDFLALLKGEIDVREDPEQQLSFEYFFNRLYVAASRAKGQLVVVDSGDAFEAFWRFATDPDVVDRLSKQVREPAIWEDSINFLVRGREESWSGQRIDPREQGAEYAAQGRRKRDPYLMRQAALAYRSADDELEAGRYLALAAEFEGKLGDAGNRYRNIGLLNDAFRCYWDGQDFVSVCDVAAKEVAFASRLESRAADFVVGSDGGIVAPFLAEILKAASHSDWRADAIKDATWRAVLVKIAEQLSKSLAQKTLPWRDTFLAFKQLTEDGLPFPDQAIACIAYAAREYAVAADIWERAGGTERDEYRFAKARLTPFPGNIIWLGRLRQHGEVLTQWREHRSKLGSALVTLDGAIVATVIDAALHGGDLTLAIELLSARPDRDRTAALLLAAARKNEPATVRDAAVLAVRILVGSCSWSALVQLAENSDFGDILKGASGPERALVRATLGAGDGTNMMRVVVEELAGSEELATESPDRCMPVTDFLHRTFIGKGAAVAKLGLSAEAVGAAIERAGKIIDALQYYENLGRDATTDDLRQFATERLVRNLERHVVYFRERGDEGLAREREVRIKRAREIGRLMDRPLPDYPVLKGTSPRRETRQPPAPSEWIRGPFKFLLSRAHARLRIEHTERFETVTVDGHARQLRGDAAFEQTLCDGVLATWRIPAWEMTIQLTGSTSAPKILANFAGEKFEHGLTEGIL